jgi:peptide/nickel transport system permease protein
VLSVIGRRLLSLVPVLLIVSFAAFSLILLIPGDPAITLAGTNPSPARIAAVREQLGLNDPLYVQYGRWLGNLARGDLGDALFKPRSVWELISSRLPVTLSLTFGGMIVGLLLGVPLGIYAASRSGRLADRVTSVAASLGVAAPNYWLALLLVIAFALRLGWFPVAGYVGPTTHVGEWLHHLVLPSIALGLATAAEIARQLRSSMIDVLNREYVRTAVAKGLRARVVLLRHGLRNAALPVVTVLGLQFARLFGGAVIVEQIFNMNGLGRLAVDAVTERDFPVVQGVVVVAVIVAVLCNLVVDVSYAWLNPKVRGR